MRYLSVCAGIEAASVAWHSLGWTPVAFSEIEPFPCAVLKHHYPDVPNWGDMTKFKEWPDADVVVLVGGTPCQPFSVAGLRQGLNDPRGNLMLTFLGIAGRYRPKWIVWENVPGVLSSNGGRDFGTFLTAMGELGYGWAFRVLDAQWFGVAQRRRRVFVVGCLGDQRSAAAVLFERESLCRNFEKSRKARQGASGSVAHSLTAGGFDASEDGTGRGTLLVPEVCGPLTAKGPEALGAPEVDAQHYVPITFGARMSMPQTDVDMAQMMQATNPMAVAQPFMQVRRLTCVECERLQGFCDGYTAIPWCGKPADQCPDGPRYKALGNSMAVPVIKWLGERIQMVNDLMNECEGMCGV